MLEKLKHNILVQNNVLSKKIHQYYKSLKKIIVKQSDYKFFLIKQIFKSYTILLPPCSK
jgi:hypothetical protein